MLRRNESGGIGSAMAVGRVRIEIVAPRQPSSNLLEFTAATVGYVEVTMPRAMAGRPSAGPPRLDFLLPNEEIDTSRDHSPEIAHATYVLGRWPEGWPAPDRELQNLIVQLLRWP